MKFVHRSQSMDVELGGGTEKTRADVDVDVDMEGLHASG